MSQYKIELGDQLIKLWSLWNQYFLFSWGCTLKTIRHPVMAPNHLICDGKIPPISELIMFHIFLLLSFFFTFVCICSNILVHKMNFADSQTFTGRLRVFDLLASLELTKSSSQRGYFLQSLQRLSYFIAGLVSKPSAKLSAETPQKTHVGSVKQICPPWGLNDQDSFTWI